MFIGHFAVGFAARGLAARSSLPRLSLGTLFLAAQLADLLWPTLLLLGLEKVRIAPGITAVTPLDFVHYPISHSLLLLVAWGVVLAVLHRLKTKSRTALGVLLVAVVASHWLLDFVTHRPDLLLTPYGDRFYGLGLWNSLKKTIVVEGAMFAGAVALYAWATRARDRVGRWGLVSLVVFLLVVYAANLFGPPPPSVAAIAWAGHAMWLLVAWGFWLDAHREPRRTVA